MSFMDEEYHDLGMVEDARHDTQDAARRVRHCEKCIDGGFIHVDQEHYGKMYDCAKPCECRDEWKRTFTRMVAIWKQYLNDHPNADYRYEDLVSNDMMDLHKVSKDEDLVSVEDIKFAVELIKNIGRSKNAREAVEVG